MKSFRKACGDMDVAGNYKQFFRDAVGMTPGHQTRSTWKIGYEEASLFSIGWSLLAEHKQQARFSEAKPKHSTPLGHGGHPFLPPR